VGAVEAPDASVNRTVPITVTASDDVGVTEVRFFVDGNLIGSDDSAPYEIDWDTSAEADGDHTLTAEAEDAAGNVGQSEETVVSVLNTIQFDVALDGEQEVPASGSQAIGQATLTVNLASGAVEGQLTLTGLDATAAHIHDAFAGTNGGVLVPLEQDGTDPSLFAVPADAALDAAGVDRLLAGALYVNAHTAAFPGGEIRGQILPDGFVLSFTSLSGDNEVPQLSSFASGRAAVTLDQDSGALVVQVQADGLDDATQSHVHDAYAGSNGPVLVALSQDPEDTGRWFVEDATLNAAGLEAFAAGRLYVNVHSPANPGGEIRGQIVPDDITLIDVPMSGEQEVPAVETDASGRAFLTFDAESELLTIHANASGLDDASAAHLHLAYAGTNGPVEIGLTQDGSDPGHWFAEEHSLTSLQLLALLAGQTYVNIHTPANPGGEIRGQVVPEDIILALGRLSGDQAVPPVATDAGGTFAVTVDLVTAVLVAHANTTGVDDATAAHIHDGFAGTAGGVVIGLTQDPEDVTHWSAEATLDTAQLQALQAGGYYVNVHTPENPGGEIRGQIAPPHVEVLFTTLSGEQEVPPVETGATGIAASTVNRDTGEITLHLNATGADDATGSHIHDGFPGENGGVVIPLTQDGDNAGHWFVEDGQFDADGLAAYLSGGLYVNLHTPAFPSGLIRGQIVPPDAAPVDEIAPSVTLQSPAAGADVSGVTTLEADASDDTAVTEVRFLVDGALVGNDTTAPYTFDWDSASVGDGEVTLTAEAEDAAGNVGTSTEVVVNVQNGVAVTLTEIQQLVFTPMCSGCHSGPTSTALPSGMDLGSTADSFAALVGVASLQVPELNRVEPGDPDSSYLIDKLEGTQTVGSRMPQGGPFLDQETIDLIREWISNGAEND
jgi:hypothetical protein